MRQIQIGISNWATVRNSKGEQIKLENYFFRRTCDGIKCFTTDHEYYWSTADRQGDLTFNGVTFEMWVQGFEKEQREFFLDPTKKFILKNPHNLVSRQGKAPLDHWKCDFCEVEGTFTEVHAKECTHEYEVCKYCGGAPTCDINCTGIAMALSHPDVYVIGDQKGKYTKNKPLLN